jgi:hypothetical protein
MIIEFEPDGTIRYVAEPETKALVADVSGSVVSRRRASRIEPVSWPLRAAFLIIRWMAPDGSRLAAWTRSWSCQWRVRYILGNAPILGPFPSRSQAITAEVEWLNANPDYWNP